MKKKKRKRERKRERKKTYLRKVSVKENIIGERQRGKENRETERKRKNSLNSIKTGCLKQI